MTKATLCMYYARKGIVVLLGSLFTSIAVAADALFIGPDGLVGIGTSNPTELLHLNGEISPGFLKMRLEQIPTNAWAYTVTTVTPKNAVFRISKQGSGGPEIEIAERNDSGGVPTLEVYGSIQATNVSFSSSSKLKTDVTTLDTQDILARLSELPINQWRFKNDKTSTVHYGPMAEDFTDAFDLNGTGETISIIDTNGIALAAIQGLTLELKERDKKIDKLEAQLEALNKIDKLEAQLEALKTAVAELGSR